MELFILALAEWTPGLHMTYMYEAVGFMFTDDGERPIMQELTFLHFLLWKLSIIIANLSENVPYSVICLNAFQIDCFLFFQNYETVLFIFFFKLKY